MLLCFKGYVMLKRKKKNDLLSIEPWTAVKKKRKKHKAAYRSSSIYLTLEENSGKLQLGDSMMKVTTSVSNGIPYLQTTSVGPHSIPVREREQKKETIEFGPSLKFELKKLLSST